MNAGIKEERRKGKKKETSHPLGNKLGQLSHISALRKQPTVTSRNSPMLGPTVQRTSVNLQQRKGTGGGL